AQPTDSTLQIQICEGESYQGIVYTQNETLTETLTNAANCDSLLTTQILVTPLYNDTIPSAICEGESVQGIPIFQDTVLVFSETSLTGCDSITTMLVSVNPQKSNAFPWEICDGETYILGSQMLTQDGTYSETFQTTEGCDSLVTVNLTVLSTVNNAIDTTICSGQTYTFDGNSLTEAGTYTATETTPDGCEKITTLTLNIAQPTDSTLQIQICEGESLQGIVYTQNETLTETLTNAANCDSLLTTQILVTPLYNDTIPSTICEGESVQGIPIFQDTVLVFSETSATGCDSITTLLVRVNNDQTNTFATEICEGETYVLGNQSLSTSGTYTELFQTTEGCDSLVTVELSFLTTVEATLEATICAGETYLFDGQDLAENGVYTASQITPNGCDSTTTLSLTIEDAFLLDLGEDQIVSLGDTVQLAATNANGIIFYEWESDSPLSCFDCPNPSLTVEGSTSVRLTATNTANCQSEATVNFRLKDYEIYQPTAFSPNDDGVNELFELGFGQDVNIVRRFLIFDRWGNELYSVEMVAPDSPDLSWNGYFKDVLLDKGIYIWIAEVEFTDSTVKQFASEVLLMR
ncbi:MAG: gliding motility-associated C-terminal domain-containing protein, partial [Bacteroidota bacterium]